MHMHPCLTAIFLILADAPARESGAVLRGARGPRPPVKSLAPLWPPSKVCDAGDRHNLVARICYIYNYMAILWNVVKHRLKKVRIKLTIYNDIALSMS